MGQTIKSGTGLCNILLDEDYLLKELKIIDEFKDEIEESENDINILLAEEEEENDECSNNNFKFSFE